MDTHSYKQIIEELKKLKDSHWDNFIKEQNIRIGFEKKLKSGEFKKMEDRVMPLKWDYESLKNKLPQYAELIDCLSDKNQICNEVYKQFCEELKKLELEYTESFKKERDAKNVFSAFNKLFYNFADDFYKLYPNMCKKHFWQRGTKSCEYENGIYSDEHCTECFVRRSTIKN